MKHTTFVAGFIGIHFFFVVFIFVIVIFRKLDTTRSTPSGFGRRWPWNRPGSVLDIYSVKNRIDILLPHAFRFMLGPIGFVAIGTERYALVGGLRRDYCESVHLQYHVL